MNILDDLKPIKIYENEPLSHFTFTKTGGPGDFVIFPKNKEELKKVVDYANKNEIPLTIIGNASNLIIKDGGIRGFVLILTEMKAMKALADNQLYSEAGARLIDLSYLGLKESLTGLEFACGIPGSVGGALFMNAGAYDGEISTVVKEVEVLTTDGEFKHYSGKELAFSYRHSLLQETKDIVISGVFQLEVGDYNKIKEKMADLTFKRESKQPLELPSCGSVFKRPVGHFTGKLIQEAGLQGFQIGGAQVSMKHAGFIVNVGGATATDYLDVIHHIQETILEKDGVTLQTEVRVLGEEK